MLFNSTNMFLCTRHTSFYLLILYICVPSKYLVSNGKFSYYQKKLSFFFIFSLRLGAASCDRRRSQTTIDAIYTINFVMTGTIICKNLLVLILLKIVIAFSSEAITVPVPKMNIGFIGCGTIASSIATGLLRQREHPISTIYVTRRSEKKSSKLVEAFPDKVIICDDNQEICDKCELIFLCVLPEQVSSVLNAIHFTNDKMLISLVSTTKLDDLVHQSGLPSENCFKMICLPAVAELEGTPLIVPKSNSYVPTLMASLG